MKKSISRIIGVIMLIVAIVFIVFALNHPEKSFPWNNTITWLLLVIFHHVPIGERNIMVVIATICQCVWTLKLENRRCV